MDRVDAKIENLHHTIAEFTASDEWANADILGKLGIAWDKIVAEPFDEWWNGSGRQFFADRAQAWAVALAAALPPDFWLCLALTLPEPLTTAQLLAQTLFPALWTAWTSTESWTA